MNLSIVDPYSSFAMKRAIEPLLAHRPLGWEVTVGREPDREADVVLHVPWHSLVTYDPPAGQKQVMLYTHCNPGAENLLRQAAAKADHIIFVSRQGSVELARYCPDFGAPVSVITPDVDDFHIRKVRVGVIGAEQPNGRKRSHLLVDLAWKMDLTPFTFVIVGAGWEPVIQQLQSCGVSVESYEHLEPEQLQLFYANGIDVLLVTAFREGGPLPLIEALACGTPVLSPSFGLAKEYLDQYSRYDSDEELMERLREYASVPRRLRDKVAHLTAAVYAERHYDIFDRLHPMGTTALPYGPMTAATNGVWSEVKSG